MATPQTVAFHTLGCKLNFSETSTIRRKFEDLGFGTVEWNTPADVYVLNTCSVTDFADKKCRAEVRRALRLRPEAKVIVIGCYAQLKPNEIAEIPGVDLVLGAAEKFNVHNYVENLSKSPAKGLIRASEVSEVNSFEEAFSFGDRTRTFLKVQDGCDYKCTFCTIPQARGASRSNSIEKVVANAKVIAANGVKEIVLTGVNIGDFGNNNDRNERFIDLIKALDKVEGIKRIRISSIEPNLCHDDVISFVADSQLFLPHFHMPLQSGSNRILALMRRRYNRELYQDRVAKIRELMPHACIGVDVIVGFPNETDVDFQDTFAFLEDLDVNYFHVFTYSERANTLATDMPNSVPMKVRRARNDQLRRLSDKKKHAFYASFLGTTQDLLVEQSSISDHVNGFTSNYVKVLIPNGDNSIQVNDLINVKLIEIGHDMEVIGQYLRHTKVSTKKKSIAVETNIENFS